MKSVVLAATLAMCAGLTATAQGPTHTSLTAETRDVDGKTVVEFWATVTESDGTPAKGVVTLVDAAGEKLTSLASSVLDAEGHAEIHVGGLRSGDHVVKAVYNGGAAGGETAVASESESVIVHPLATATPSFTLAIAPSTLTLKQGTAGTVAVTITPVNSFSGFISLSCAGTGVTTTLPVGVTCTYSPANLQVSATAPSTATLSIQTSTAGGKHAENRGFGTKFFGFGAKPVVLAVLIPGVFLVGIGGRRRRMYGHGMMLIMLGSLTLMGTVGCAARYNYLNHGPTFTGTPLGSYNITLSAQTSNGVTSSAQSANLVLTVH